MHLDTAFQRAERKRQVTLNYRGFFGTDIPDGYYIDKEGKKCYRHFILPPEHSAENLYAGARQQALSYFGQNGIAWWNQDKDGYFPTGHLLSSQTHCLNHLMALRRDHTAVLAIIRSIAEPKGIHFDRVLPSPVDTDQGYITFEFVCHNTALLNERHEKRGEKCTSIDALVYAQAGEQKWLIPIEWKYTEAYDHKPEAYNWHRYRAFVAGSSRLECWSELYKAEPFYELARQTLLAERVIARKEISGIDADNFIHLVVVPEKNESMRHDAGQFRATLSDNGRQLFCVVAPEELLSPVADSHKELMSYLAKRYWQPQE